MSCKKNLEVKVPSHNTRTIQKQDLNKNIYDLEKYSRHYQPSKIDFSDNKKLNAFDLRYIYSKELDKEDSLRNEIADILLLKQYLFHLSNCNQGYDLLSMIKGQAKFIIDYFLTKHNLIIGLEMLNSGHPYTILKMNKNQSKEVNDLCKKIEIEDKRILKQ